MKPTKTLHITYVSTNFEFSAPQHQYHQNIKLTKDMNNYVLHQD